MVQRLEAIRQSLVYQILSPFKTDLTFLKEYHHNLHQKFLWNLSNTLSRPILLIVYLNSIRILQNVILYLFPVTYEIRLINFDYNYFIQLPGEYRLVFAAFELLSNYLLCLLYADIGCFKLSNLIYQVLFLRKANFYFNNSNDYKAIRLRIIRLLEKFILFFQIFMQTGGNFCVLIKVLFYHVFFVSNLYSYMDLYA